MDYAQVFAISAAGMSVQRSRVEVAALNLANANTVQGPDGAGYQPMRVQVRPAAAFGQLVGSGLQPAAAPAVSIEAAGTPPRMVYEPGHPLADGRGFVRYAGVDPATEMVTLMSAMRSYEANVAAMNTARTLVLKTLEIGEGRMNPEAIQAIGGHDEVAAPALAPRDASAAPAGAAFSASVSEGLQALNQQLLTSQVDLQHLAAGDAVNLHEVMVRLEESRIGLQLMLQVRNRALEAYQDVMRMQL